MKSVGIHANRQTHTPIFQEARANWKNEFESKNPATADTAFALLFFWSMVPLETHANALVAEPSAA